LVLRPVRGRSLTQHLAKTSDMAYISHYRDNEYLEALNDMNTISSMNIHSFIIGSPVCGDGQWVDS
jgi:hypothetical protein